MKGVIIGVPRETLPGERRVAATPESVRKLIARGFVVRVQRGAGALAGIDDEAYGGAGAELVDDPWPEADALLKVRPPTLDEAARLKERAVLVALLQPERNPGLTEALKARRVTALALERVPRITRAQKMDVLSSMANLAGYRAVLEAAHHFQGPFSPQVTAAGTTPPARVLVIGAGVAGLAAIAAARALGADVRAFDTRAAAREQVESLGARFIEVDLAESGEGKGGYARVMSPEFIAAEMALFRAQAREVDVVIATALVPGAKAPVLLPRDVVEQLKPGSVIVDMAAEQGGNCELCVPGEVVEHRGVKILGYTDLTSRMAATASRFFAMNVFNLLGELDDALDVDIESDVLRPALLLYRGEELPAPAPKTPAPSAAKVKTRPPPPDAKPLQQHISSPTRRAWGSTVGGFAVIAGLFLLGRFAPPDFLRHSTVFVLACFVGWQVIWSVQPSLHTPLMAVTNAISGIIVVGGLLQVGPTMNAASVLGVIAVFFATINITGGFLVTHRMLKMFRRDAAPAKGAHR
ncbi:MAG: Re/Si-specific NAD(P)(+) transhydrogenase subunit alpha [Deltaproteobacteria bacterium]|nr:Re/Si-specific NAD(P)(+) transhydrogenase subunit alpha [Myxococcales bacterium]MDP3214509.1 Re/Si-specific NAD(P)(+) transhydrogenase subunit alpha [Deltaproteobacteria bacterium]